MCAIQGVFVDFLAGGVVFIFYYCSAIRTLPFAYINREELEDILKHFCLYFFFLHSFPLFQLNYHKTQEIVSFHTLI